MDNKVRADIMEHGFKVVSRHPADDRLLSATPEARQVEYEIGRPARPPRKWHLGGMMAGRGAGPLAVFAHLDPAIMFLRNMEERGYLIQGCLEIWRCSYVPEPPGGDKCLWCYSGEGYRETALGSLPNGTHLAEEVTLISKVEYKIGS